MSDNKRKIVLIILFIIVVIGLAFLIYYVFFTSSRQPVTPQQEQQNQSGEFPSASEGGAQQIEQGGGTPQSGEVQGNTQGQGNVTSEETIINSKQLLDKDVSRIKTYSKINDGIVYYDDANQGFYRVTSDGKVSKLSDRKFYNVTNATFSPTKNEAIIEYPDKTKVLYDFDKDEFIAKFPEQAQDFGFSTTGDKLSYKWIDYYEDSNYLVTSNPDASNFKFIRPIADQAKNIDDVWSPDGEVMATFKKQYDAERQEIYFINENDKNLRSLLVDGFNFKGTWNTKGDKLLYNITELRNDFKPTLWIANGQGDSLGYGKRPLGLNTWVDKCSFSQSDNDVVYCAVPDELEKGSGLNSSSYGGSSYSIYRINIATGNQELLAQPIIDNNRISIDKIYTDKNDSSLFYVDGSSGYLYSIDLNK